LIHTFGEPQCLLGRGEARSANDATRCELHLVVCTTRDRHVLEDLTVEGAYYEHRASDVEPPLLGFECHEVLRERLDGYDYYGYLEDDLILADPWFLSKLMAFRHVAGCEKLLLPNRFERTQDSPLLKAYIDGPIRTRYLASLRQPSASPQEIVRYLNVPILTRRPRNPHSGCFFLHQIQMAKWATRSYFLDRDTSFVGPLESAATLGIARTFAIYKPAPRVANFLETEHCGRKWIDRLVAGRRVGDAGKDDSSDTSSTLAFHFAGPDWFTYQLSLWVRLLKPLAGRANIRVLEIGTFEGRAAVWLLENVLTDPTSQLVCVDTFGGSDENRAKLSVNTFLNGLHRRFINNIRATGRSDQVQVIVGRSQTELRRLKGQFDFIYVDGSHHAPDVIQDAIESFRLVKTGGLILFDDYEWTDPAVPIPPRPAIDAFLDIYRDQLRVVHRGYQLCVQKMPRTSRALKQKLNLRAPPNSASPIPNG
jgi:predicted O-methyltransferase YrrM